MLPSLLDRPLANRVALVTGASRGIGRGIALALAQAGAHIAVNYCTNLVAANQTCAEIQAMGSNTLPVRANVSQPSEVWPMVQTVVDHLGPIDLLVNNAGIPSTGRSIEETDPVELDQLLRVHLFGAWYCTQAVLPIMQTCAQGNIIFISSHAATKCKAGSAPYSIAKAAMEALAKTLAKELRPKHIRVNIISPGLTDTDMGRGLVSRRGGDLAQVAQAAPFGRLVQAAEVGQLCVYLASEQGSYISYESIHLDGGG